MGGQKRDVKKVQRAAKLRERGLSFAAIGIKLGMSAAGVRAMLISCGCHPPGSKSGRRNQRTAKKGNMVLEPDNAKVLEEARKLVTYLSRHLVCLAINYIRLDPQGRDVGETKFAAYSGFVVLFHDSWLLITAGHVLEEELDDNVRDRQIRIVNSILAGYFGPNPKDFNPTYFDYEDTPKFYIDDRRFGLDLGLLYLRPYPVQHLSATGVVPVSEENWLHQHKVAFDYYGLLGFPSHLVNSSRRQGEFGDEIVGLVQPTFVWVEKLNEIPEKVEHSELPWFVGQIHPNADLPSIRGMSGGPIFGLKITPDRRIRYWIVALQSWWDKEKRIIFGCPVPVFMGLLENGFQESTEDREGD
jgi:hypothetical protein